MSPITITALLAIIFTLSMVIILFVIAMTYLSKTRKAISGLHARVEEVAALILKEAER